MRKVLQWKSIGAAGVVALLSGADAGAQEKSVYIGNAIPVTDALDHNFPGSWLSPSSDCARVEIRQVGPGGIVAPDPVTGEGSPLNPLVRVSRIGMNVEPPADHLGKFKEQFTNRLELVGMTNFVRVFDHSDPSEALYYADSGQFQDVPPLEWATTPSLDVEFGSLKLVSTGEPDVDSDGDGIPDAMEDNETGTMSNNPDSDGDGYNDWFEAHFNDFLSPTETNRPLEIQIAPPANLAVDPHVVSWETIPVPAMTYRLDYRPRWVDGDEYTNIWSGSATDTLLEIDVQEWVDTQGPMGFFRVTVPYEGP